MYSWGDRSYGQTGNNYDEEFNHMCSSASQVDLANSIYLFDLPGTSTAKVANIEKNKEMDGIIYEDKDGPL